LESLYKDEDERDVAVVHRVEGFKVDRVDVFEKGRERLIYSEGGEGGGMGVDD
jgi:hypothetical protein